jgi:hypothetical protein
MSDELDLDDRELCPDGACIGVLGSDRICKVCGKAADGTPFRGTPVSHTDETDEDEASASEDEDSEESEELEEQAAGSSFDDDRKLCPDGTCVGVIGEDGRCKVCGAVGR